VQEAARYGVGGTDVAGLQGVQARRPQLAIAAALARAGGLDDKAIAALGPDALMARYPSEGVPTGKVSGDVTARGMVGKQIVEVVITVADDGRILAEHVERSPSHRKR
jgi:hypothetical protein